MPKFIVTYPLRLNTRNHYTIVEAVDETAARLMLNRRLNNGWAMIYPDGESSARMIEKYGLTEIPLTHGLEDEDDGYELTVREVGKRR